MYEDIGKHVVPIVAPLSLYIILFMLKKVALGVILGHGKTTFNSVSGVIPGHGKTTLNCLL